MENMMFDTPLSTAVTIVMTIGFVLMAIALPPLKQSNDQVKARIAARKKRLDLDDGY